MDATFAINLLRRGDRVHWPQNSHTFDFARSLDNDPNLVNFRDDFIIPTCTQLEEKSLLSSSSQKCEQACADDSSVYFCGNSLGLQSKTVAEYLTAYLKTWGSVAVGGHFSQMKDSPLVPFQDLAADCSSKSADIVGAATAEIVIMNTLTINLHLMMVAFYKPTGAKHKIMLEWRPFPSDYYAIESQIEWHGRNAKDSMLLVQPDEGSYLMSTANILSLITEHADELALILLPGIQYYSGQLLDIATITKHAHAHDIVIGWDLAHAAGNVELKLHDWDVDFACWCTYKYMNAGAGSIAGAFVHENHGDVVRNGGLRGWYGGDKSVRFLMDNKFVPTTGAQGFAVSNPSAVDLTCLSASLSIFNRTSMAALRSKSLLLTAYAEHLLNKISLRNLDPNSNPPFRIITPSEPLERGAQLSVLLKEELMDNVTGALQSKGVVCDKRKPGCIRVAPAPLYNTFFDVWRFMEIFESGVQQHQKGGSLIT